MKVTQINEELNEDSGINYYGFADQDQARARNMKSDWIPYPATHEGHLQAIEDGYTAKSIYSFSHPVPDEKNQPQPIRRGNFILDFDAKREIRDKNGDVIKTVGDIEKSLKAVIAFTDYMHRDFELDPESLLYFASGGKGFHVEIPSEVFGAEHGAIELPSIYGCIYSDFLRPNRDKIKLFKDGAGEALYKSKQYATFDFDAYVDKCGFKGGKSHLLRMPNIKRSDGKYKVPVTWDEICNESVEFFENIVLKQRILEDDDDLHFAQRKKLQPNPKLEKMFLQYKIQLSKYKMNANPTDALNMIVGECDFMNSFHDNPYEVDEPRWFILARLLTHSGAFGTFLFHSMSRFDKQRYNRRECDGKLRHAFNYGVATCKEIRKQGYCQKDCGVKSPIDIFQKKHAASYDEGRFEPTAEGLYYYPDPNDHSNKVLLSSYINVKALARDVNSVGWSKLVEVKDPDNITHCIILSSTDLSGSGELALAILSAKGLSYDTNQHPKAKLMKYLRTTQPKCRALLVNKNGWIGDISKFFPFDEGEQEDGNFIHSLIPTDEELYTQKGTIEEWQTHIAELCAGNPLLQITIMTALAAPFLKHLEHSSFGLHLYYSSSSGKTTILNSASSVSGVKGKNWRATDNALEGIAVEYNHSCLFLDEIGQCDPDVVSRAVYMLGNDHGKARCSKDGSTKKIANWNFLFVSTGEISIADKIKQGFNKTPMAGQEVRCISILADGGTGQGVFTHIPKNMTPADFADTLTKNSKKYKGLAILKVIDFIKMSDKESIVHDISSEKKKFLIAIDKKLSPQAERVARHFAYLAAVGEYCINRKLLPWKSGEAHLAAAFCFKQWLQHDGSTENLEIKKIADNLLNLVMHDFYNKFNSFETSTKENQLVFSYTEGGKECWFISRQYLISAGICKQYQYNQLVQYLSKKKLLVQDSKGKVQVQKWRYGGDNKNRPPRGFSIIKDEIYSSEDDRKDDVTTVDTSTEHINSNIEPANNDF